MAASPETRKWVIQTQYWRDLRRMLQDAGGIQQENGLNIKKIAAVAGTHPKTTKRLFDGTTLFPQHRTVWCNLAALSYRMQLVERAKISPKQIAAARGPKRRKKPRGKKRRRAKA